MNVQDLDTPVPVVDVNKLDANLTQMASAIAATGTALRPHAKTHKTAEIARRQLELGAIGLTVAKVGEAEALVEKGFDDILIAYPVLGTAKYERLLQLMDRARLRISLDSLEVAEAAAAFFAPRGRQLPCLIEIDVGFGRTGVQSEDEALALAEAISSLDGIEVEGVMVFGGQAYQTAERAEQAAVGRREAEYAVGVARALSAAGHNASIVSAGSTPTAESAASVEGVTEVRPGVYAFYDLKQVSLGLAPLSRCALTVLATVVSHPRPDRYVIDAGLKALAGENYGWGTYGRLLDHNGLTINWAAEEHGIIEAPGDSGQQLKIGDKVRVVPDHACGTVNMHDELVAADGDAVLERWRVIARGRVR